MKILFVFFSFIVWVRSLFTLNNTFYPSEMQVDFAVFKFFERVCNSEFILFHADERRNMYC